MKRRPVKKIMTTWLALVMGFALSIGSLPLTAFAAEDTAATQSTEAEESSQPDSPATSAPDESNISEPEQAAEPEETGAPTATAAVPAETAETDEETSPDVLPDTTITPRIITDTYTVGDLKYRETAAGQVQVTGHVDDTSATGSVSIPATIEVSVNGENKTFRVTSIGGSAFRNCTNLSSATIPDSVTSIGNSAFTGCMSLISVSMGSSVTSIGDYAFDSCTNLSSVTIPDSVTRIGNYTFDNCTSLISVSMGSSVTSIGDYAFNNCTNLSSVTIPDSVTRIGDYAFDKCTSLSSVTIPDSVTSIGRYAFARCTSLTSVTIPDSVTSIGRYAFYSSGLVTSSITVTSDRVYALLLNSGVAASQINYSVSAPIENELINGLKYTLYSEGGNNYAIVTGYIGSPTDLAIPATVMYSGSVYSVTSIGDNAFNSCNSLASVTIPNSVTSIGSSAFNSASLSSVTIPDSVTGIGDRAFFSCTSLASVTIPNSVTSIGSNAFARCYSLSSVTISNSLTSIGEAAFYYCTSLNSVTIPDSVTSIGRGAFSVCTSLTSIAIPNSVETIGEHAFSGADLTSVSFGKGLQSIGANAFSNLATVTITTNSPRVQLVLVKDLPFAQGDYPYCSWEVDEDVPGGAIAHVDADRTATQNYVIESGAEITVGAGKALTVDTGSTLTVDGDLDIQGTAAGSGEINVSSGTIQGNISGVKITYDRIYPIIGANTFTLDGNDITFTVDADYEKYLQTRTDDSVYGTTVTTTAGSTVITLSASYLDTLSNGTHTIYALFKDGIASVTLNPAEPPAQTYPLSVGAGAGGSVSGSASGSYDSGTAVSVTATADSGCRFTGWTADGITLSSLTDNPASFNMPANAVTLTANFESTGGTVNPKETYTVTYSSGDATSGNAPAPASYAEGSSITVKGQGNLKRDGYRFTGWKNSLDDKTYTEGQTFTLTGNATLTAQWEKVKTKSSGNVPKTGDTGVFPYILLACSSLCGIGGVSLFRKRKKNDQ